MYFWDGSRVIHVPISITVDKCDQHMNMYCCDDRCDDPFGRYGMFVERPKHQVYWNGIPIHEFPKEFRASLLLLGVT